MNTNLLAPAEGNGTAQPSVTPSRPRAAAPANLEIIPANLRALESVYLAAMLEEVCVFDVVDRLVLLFAQGLLPLSPGRAGAILYRYWRKTEERLTTAERHTVYARAFGLPCDDAGVDANSKFNDLWIPFVSIVGMYSAELQVLPPSERSVGPQEILAVGRDLAINLTSHGRGLAWFAAHEFKPELQQIFELLADTELQAIFGAKDAWQLVAIVAVSELGIRPNVPRGRTRGESGSIIIRWLSNRRTRLLRPRSANILRDEDICEGRTAASLNKKATVYPTDSDLVTACEQWLAVTGTQEARLKDDVPLEEMSPAPAPVELAPVEPAPDESKEVDSTVKQPAAEPTVTVEHPVVIEQITAVEPPATVEIKTVQPAEEPDKAA